MPNENVGEGRVDAERNLANANGVPQARSPKYPYIDLRVAEERAARIFEKVRNHAQPRPVIAQAVGMAEKSSATQQTFGALSQYGLLENASGNTVRLSSAAQELCGPFTPESKKLDIREGLALNSPIFREIAEKFGDTLEIADELVLYHLTSGRATEGKAPFTEKGARDALRIYRSTVKHANLDGIELSGVNAGDNDRDAMQATEDLSEDTIQPSASGQAKVHVTDRGSQNSVRTFDFADIAFGREQQDPKSSSTATPETAGGLLEGERLLQSGIPSRDGASYRLIVSGHIGVRELEKLVSKIEIDKEILADN